jgi:hypothetical protein
MLRQYGFKVIGDATALIRCIVSKSRGPYQYNSGGVVFAKDVKFFVVQVWNTSWRGESNVLFGCTLNVGVSNG